MYRLALALLALSACTRSGPNLDRIQREERLARFGGAVPVDSLVQWNAGSIPRRFDYLKDTILSQTWIAWAGQRICIIPDWMVRYISHGDRPQCIWYSPRGV